MQKKRLWVPAGLILISLCGAMMLPLSSRVNRVGSILPAVALFFAAVYLLLRYQEKNYGLLRMGRRYEELAQLAGESIFEYDYKTKSLQFLIRTPQCAKLDEQAKEEMCRYLEGQHEGKVIINLKDANGKEYCCRMFVRGCRGYEDQEGTRAIGKVTEILEA